MDFKNAKELLALCQEKKLPISEVMRQREILLGETTAEIVGPAHEPCSGDHEGRCLFPHQRSGDIYGRTDRR